jgi:DNA-binding protein YbaB
MKSINEKIQKLNDRKGNLFQERIQVKEMVNSMEKQIDYLNKRLQQIEIEKNDINNLRSVLINSKRKIED